MNNFNSYIELTLIKSIYALALRAYTVFMQVCSQFALDAHWLFMLMMCFMALYCLCCQLEGILWLAT